MQQYRHLLKTGGRNTMWQRDSWVISTDKNRLNIAVIWQFLRTSYWASKRSLAQVAQSIDHSYCFGVYEAEQQIGFARVITDYVTFAYLADVFILPSHRKLGLGKWLTHTIMTAEPVAHIEKWLLLTDDAQALYEQVGFMPFPYPERVMIRSVANNT